MSSRISPAKARRGVGVRILAVLMALTVASALTALPGVAAPKNGGKAEASVSMSGDMTVGGQVAIVGKNFKKRTAVFIVPSDGSNSVLVETDRNGAFSATWTASSSEASNLAFYALMKKGGWSQVLVVPITIQG